MKIINYTKRYLAIALALIVLLTSTSLNMFIAVAENAGEPEVFSAAFQPYSNSLGESFLTTWSHEGTYKSGINYTDMFTNGWNSFTERKYTGEFPFRTDWNGEITARIAGLTPLDTNKRAPELKNFELTFDYRVPINTQSRCGAVWVGFRQKEAGRLADLSNKNQSFARITNTGITVASGNNISGSLHGDGSEDVSMPSAGTTYLSKDGSLITVNVKVVGNSCTVSVLKTQSKEEILTYTEELDASALETGYLTLGIADRQIHMISLKVKRLDDSGKAIDFTDYSVLPEVKSIIEAQKTVKIGTEFSNIGLPTTVAVTDEFDRVHQCKVTWDSEGYVPDQIGKYTVYGNIVVGSTFNNTEEHKAKAIINVVNDIDVQKFESNFTGYNNDFGDIFSFSWNHEVQYKKDLLATDCFNNLANEFAERSNKYEGYMLAGEYFSRAAAMSPKLNGELTTVKNFELTADFRVPWDVNGPYGAIFVGFHQKEAGHFFTHYQQFNTEQSFVRVTNTGVTVKSGEKVNEGAATAEDIALSSNAMKKADGRFSIYVKVLDNVCYVRVYETKTGNVICEYTESLDGATATGYISIGIGDAIYAIDNLVITRLNNDGIPVDFSNIDKYNVVSVKETSINAEYGTEFENLNLPQTVEVTDVYGTKHNCKVIWSKAGYNKLTSGKQILTGTLELSPELLNPDNVVAKIAVYMVSPELEKFHTDFTNYNASYAELFNYYWNHEVSYVTDVQPTACFNNLAGNFAERYKSEYDAGLAGEYFSRTASMSPKEKDGTQARIKNFDLTLNFRVSFSVASRYGGILVGFHQKEAGHFFNHYATYNQQQGFVRLTNSGLTIASGQNIKDMNGTKVNEEDISINNSVLKTADGRVTLNIVVINDVCEVTVKNTNTGDLIATYSEKIDPAVLATGYLSVGVMDSVYALDSLSIIKLDDNGNHIPFSTKLPYEVVEIEKAYSVVGKGSEFEKANLPEQVLVTDDFGNKQKVDVEWDSSKYNKDTLGSVSIPGKIILPEGYINSNNIEPTATITVIKDNFTFTDSYFNDFEADNLSDALKGFKSYYADKTTSTELLKERPMEELYELKDGRLVRTETAGDMDMVSSIAMLGYTDKLYTNFQLDVDFRQGGDSWGWAMVGFGSKEPNAFFNNVQNGGTVAYVEQEGYSNLLGKIPNVANEHVRETDVLVPEYSGTCYTKIHHMTLIVYRFKVTLIIDGNVMLEQKLSPQYRGGYISLLSNKNKAIFDNLSIKGIQTPTPVAVEVQEFNSLVKFGTDVKAISFPETVKIYADDEMEYSCNVEWDLSADYNPQESGLYVFTGDLQASNEFNNPSKIKAVANIYVDEQGNLTDTDISLDGNKNQYNNDFNFDIDADSDDIYIDYDDTYMDSDIDIDFDTDDIGDDIDTESDDVSTDTKKESGKKLVRKRVLVSTISLKTILMTAIPAVVAIALVVFGLIVLYKKIRKKN